MRLPTAAFLAAALSACSTDPPALELTVADYGLAFGNAAVTHGVRMNAIDDGPREVDGLNFTVARPANVAELEVNGLSVGLWRPDAAVHRGVAVGPVVAGEHLTGIHLGLLGAASRGTMTGLNAAIVQTRAEDALCGVNVAALVGGGGDVGFLNVGGVAISPFRMSDLDGPHRGALWGLSVAGVTLDYTRVIGVAASGVIRAQDMTALSAAYLWSEVDGVSCGLQIAPFTSARELRGVQLGLVNHVWTNPWWARWLPVVNVGIGGGDGDGEGT